MVSAKPEVRRTIADVVEHLIAVIDEIDGDPDFELEPIAEQHDREFDPAEDGFAHEAAMIVVMAEASAPRRSSR